MARQEANKELVKLISEMVEKYPDWRFHQILMNCGIEISTSQFYEESEKTLKKFKKF